MRLTIAYSKIKKRNLVLINNATYQGETLSERPIRQPLTHKNILLPLVLSYTNVFLAVISAVDGFQFSILVSIQPFPGVNTTRHQKT